MQPYISFIVPVYNTPVDRLSDCVSSICAINSLPYEVLIVDDGSGNVYAQKYEEAFIDIPEVRIIHQVNGGVSAARNTGLNAAKGEYIMFVDSDDVILPDQIKSIPENIEFAIFDFIMIKRGKTIVRKGFTGQYGIVPNARLAVGAVYGGLGSCWGKYYKRSFLEKHDLHLDTECIHGEDSDFNMRVVQFSPITLYENRLIYRYNYSSGTALGRWEKMPQKMLHSEDVRFRRKAAFVKDRLSEQYSELYEKVILDRIDVIYRDALDLCSVNRASAENRKKVESMMLELGLPESAGKKTRWRYHMIVKRQWWIIFLIAKLRMCYLRIMKI